MASVVVANASLQEGQATISWIVAELAVVSVEAKSIFVNAEARMTLVRDAIIVVVVRSDRHIFSLFF